MKNSFLKLSFATLLVCTSFYSCKKDEAAPAVEETPTPVTPAAGTFTWQENGGVTITADSAFWTTGSWGTGVRAFKGGFVNFFEINWDMQNNTSVGSKALNIGGLTFLKGSDTYNNTTVQSLNVTGFSGNKLSGNFNVAVTGGSITSLSGAFTRIPVR